MRKTILILSLLLMGCGNSEPVEHPKPYEGLDLIYVGANAVSKSEDITEGFIERWPVKAPVRVFLRPDEGDLSTIDLVQNPNRATLYIGDVPDDWPCGAAYNGSGLATNCLNEPRSGLWRIVDLLLHEAGHLCDLKHEDNTFLSAGDEGQRGGTFVDGLALWIYDWQLAELESCFI